jgi:AraC-like DNA-binding protein
MAGQSATFARVEPPSPSVEIGRPRQADYFQGYGDPAFEGFVQSILPPLKAQEVLRGFYTDALHSALMDRLAALRGEASVAGKPQKLKPLQAWRLRRVHQYVEENLDQPLRLGTLATAAGLSRMHFAARFRDATGLQPHDYVARCRIERAKSMLTEPNNPIVKIALSVGYQNQAHFTMAFGRIVGETPHRWRVSQSISITHPVPATAVAGRLADGANRMASQTESGPAFAVLMTNRNPA